jgi:hypothetical protein
MTTDRAHRGVAIALHFFHSRQEEISNNENGAAYKTQRCSRE